MRKTHPIVFLACTLGSASLAFISPTQAADNDAPIKATITVNAAKVLRKMDPQRLGGTNVAMWYKSDTYDAPQIRKWVPELHARYIRIPGGSWANGVYWNGNGVRDKKGVVDPSKVGPDGYPAVDYSAYAPSFLVDTQTLHPASNGWHGNVDVKKQQDFIKAIPGTEAMACPNAGTGRAVDAAEWVKWANKKMGYNVREWEIGNELGGSWEAGTEMPLGKGHLTGEIYTARYNEMANAMHKMDPTIKIGSCPYVEETLRDCGKNVDFVSIHTYPGSTTLTEAQMFSDISKQVEREVNPVKGWISKYQPTRADKIEIAYSEWNLAGGLDNSKLFSGLWSSIFLGEIAKNGVSMATQWDCFTDLFFGQDDGNFGRKPEYYALWLWNNYMGNRLISADSTDKTVFTYASRSDNAVTVMLINTDKERDARVDVQLADFMPAGMGELATLSNREYYYNPLTKHLQWSTGPRIERLKTGSTFNVTLAPFSMTYVRIPSKTKPLLSLMAQKALAQKAPAQRKPELRFILPTEMYAGDQIQGDLIAVTAGTTSPYRGNLSPAALTANGDVTFDRSQIRLSEDAGHFTMKPSGPGELILTAQSGNVSATHKITVKASIPRPIVFWDFSNPLVTNKDVFTSEFKVNEDLTQRANRAVARIDMPAGGAVPKDGAKEVLKVIRMPDDSKLNKSNIRGAVFDLKTSPDFSCDDPDAGIMVVMQSPANWWMHIGTVSLKDAKEWKTFQYETTNPEHIKGLPSAINIIFMLNCNKPAKGSIYIDKIGFMVR